MSSKLVSVHLASAQRDIDSNSFCPSLSMSVHLSATFRYCIKWLNRSSHFLPRMIAKSFYSSTKHFCEVPTGSPPTEGGGALNKGEVYKFREFSFPRAAESRRLESCKHQTGSSLVTDMVDDSVMHGPCCSSRVNDIQSPFLQQLKPCIACSRRIAIICQSVCRAT